MKILMLAISFSMVFCSPGYTQEPSDDPLAASYVIQVGGGKEIVSSYYASVLIYKYFQAMDFADHDTVVRMLTYDPTPEYFDESSDIACDDFDHDGFSEIASARITDNHVHWDLVKPDPSLLVWDKINNQSVTGAPLYSPGTYGLTRPALIKSGNFDGDEQKEIALAYWADSGIAGGFVRILVYDVSDSLSVTLLGDIMDQRITVPPEIHLCEDYLLLFDIECADFNGDGLDEIMLSGRNGVGEGWEMFVNIYQWDTTATELILKSHTPIYSRPDHTYDIGNMNVATGHFNTTEKENGVISFFEYVPLVNHRETDTVSYLLIPFETDGNLENITFGEPVIQRHDTLEERYCYERHSTLICEDLNNDGIDEIVSSFSMWESNNYKTIKIYNGSGSNDLTVWADLTDLVEIYKGGGILTVGDVRNDTTGTAPWIELKIEGYCYEIRYDESGNFVDLDSLDVDAGSNFYPMEGVVKTEPILTAEFDADIRLGKPTRYSLTEILQPLVILNAPPIHFDVIDDTSYDVSLSYNENEGQFVSHYSKESREATEVSSEFTQDWGTSQSLQMGLKGTIKGYALGSVTSHLTFTYGKQFSKSGGYSRTVTVSDSVDAIEDDRIFATVMDYDLWEYPVYGNHELQGHVMVVRPLVAGYQWFPSKSWSGYSYIPTHEVGNILSYREYPLLSNNPDVDELIKGGYLTSYMLDQNSSIDWSLEFEDFADNEASTSKNYSREWGRNVDIFGSGMSSSGSYSSSEIQTHKTEVSTGLRMSVHLDGVDMGLGEVRYKVTPYTYWATNGALVLDYAVKPELSGPGGTKTWWDLNYGLLADPAFILPWRLDPEKGFTLEEEVKRQQTKDIVVSPSQPMNGDTILIRARVHNFSLIPTPGVVGVKFYIGDPDTGGIPMIGTLGEEQVYTETAIPARGNLLVEMKWRVPPELQSTSRLYAVIDEENSLSEIHENNNKSWVVLQKSMLTSVSDEDGIPNGYNLKQNYPNPFNPTTTIEYELSGVSMVRLTIYDVLGRVVTTLANGIEEAGYRSVVWNASHVASSVYFYRLEASSVSDPSKGFTQVRKLVLMK